MMRHLVLLTVVVLLWTLAGCSGGRSVRNGAEADSLSCRFCLPVPVASNLERLLMQEDTDGDGRITVADGGPKSFRLETSTEHRFEVHGTWPLASLLIELAAARERGDRSTVIGPEVLFSPPPERLSALIDCFYWDRLVRRIDARGLERAWQDPKIEVTEPLRLYVPHADHRTLDYFRTVARERPELELEVIRLPPRITPEYVRGLAGRHGLLALGLEETPQGWRGRPFVVPGGRFNAQYGWDSYFIALGLLNDGRIDLARGMVDNFVYQIEHYGKILNANRSYYLTRSQPPFLTAMALAVYRCLPAGEASKKWLKGALLAAIREYEEVWNRPPRLTETGLSRYHGEGAGIPPEVDPTTFAHVLRPYAEARGLDLEAFARAYARGEIEAPELNAWFRHDRAMRESGHDRTWRLSGRAADLLPVSLNALLYRYETDLARAIEEIFGGRLVSPAGIVHTPELWRQRAERRKERMNALLWDERRGVYLDYDLQRRERLDYIYAGTLYPLWAGLPGPERAALLADNALAVLEAPGGVAASAPGSVLRDREPRQWDFPFGWAPHQMLAWEGLRRYGMERQAQRLIYRWLFTIAFNASRQQGAITEKYDVLRRSFETDVAYGNVGREFRLAPEGGFGWTNASFQVGLNLLEPRFRTSLGRLIPPEWLFGAAPVRPAGGAR